MPCWAPQKSHPQSTTSGLGRHRRRANRLSTGLKVEIGIMVLQHMFTALSFLQYRKDDDFVDRLSYFYTSSFLIMMAILVSFKQFGGRPLECWVPAEFTDSWEAYTEMYCWAQNTYWLPFDEDIPIDLARREYLQISYYQWVPFFLLIESFLFYLPCMIWRLLNDKSGIRLHDIVSAACEKDNIEPDFRTRTIESLSKHLESALKYQHEAFTRTNYTLHRVFKCFNVRYYESYVTGLYLVVKWLYVCNITLNLYIMNKFLETDDYSIYGFGVLKDLLHGKRGWKDSGNFPRVTLCDFDVRVMGAVHRHSVQESGMLKNTGPMQTYTVQCVLVINIFNEKIFILLWLWFSTLLIIAILDALYWLSISLRHEDRLRFIYRHLELTESPESLRNSTWRKKVQGFLLHYIKVDGVFALRMLAAHSGVMFCTELTEALWHRYLNKEKEEVEKVTEPEATMILEDTEQAPSFVSRLVRLGKRDRSLIKEETTERETGGGGTEEETLIQREYMSRGSVPTTQLNLNHSPTPRRFGSCQVPGAMPGPPIPEGKSEIFVKSGFSKSHSSL